MNKILKKHMNIVSMFNCIRNLSFYGFIILSIIVVKEMYIREKEKEFFLKAADKELVILLSHYESAVRLSVSLDKGEDIKFINKLMSLKDDFPKIIAITNVNILDKISTEGRTQNSIVFLLRKDNKLVSVEVCYDELLLYLLSKIKTDNWFSIKVENNVDGYQIKYNGVSFVFYLVDIIFGHNVTFILFCFAIILYGISYIAKTFFLDITGTIKQQYAKLKNSEKNEKYLEYNVKNLQEYQAISRKMIYLLFNRAISNNVNSFDKEECINLYILIKEAISFLAPLYSDKNVFINIKETTDLSVKISSREILLIIILNYVYRSIVRSAKNGKIKITFTYEEKEKVILNIIDKGYFYIEKEASETRDIFSLPQELLILLSKKLGIKVMTAKTQYNITSIVINTKPTEELGKNNVIILKK